MPGNQPTLYPTWSIRAEFFFVQSGTGCLMRGASQLTTIKNSLENAIVLNELIIALSVYSKFNLEN